MSAGTPAYLPPSPAPLGDSLPLPPPPANTCHPRRAIFLLGGLPAPGAPLFGWWLGCFTMQLLHPPPCLLPHWEDCTATTAPPKEEGCISACTLENTNWVEWIDATDFFPFFLCQTEQGEPSCLGLHLGWNLPNLFPSLPFHSVILLVSHCSLGGYFLPFFCQCSGTLCLPACLCLVVCF